MACELIEHCQFCHDNMKDMPKAAEYLKARLCYGNFEHCNRFRIYQQLGGADIQCDPISSDTEVVEKILQLRGRAMIQREDETR